MLAIGRALMTNPRLLILDEGDRGVAPARPRRDLALRERPQGGRPQSLLLIDKDVGMLTRIADAHYILGKGQIVWSGTSGRPETRADIQHRYLGV